MIMCMIIHHLVSHSISIHAKTRWRQGHMGISYSTDKT